MPLSPMHSSIRALVQASQRLRHIRVGIAGRLGISFAAVALLAAAANYIVAYGDAFIRRTEVAVSPAVEDRPLVATAQMESVFAHKADGQGTRNLEMALDRYETAVLARTQTDTAETNAQLNAAETNLQRATAFFASELGATSPGEQSLRKVLQSHRASAAAMI